MFGSAKVVLPLPPYMVPSTEKRAGFCAIDSSCPCAKAVPRGGKFPAKRKT
jgi:hypothetical protein